MRTTLWVILLGLSGMILFAAPDTCGAQGPDEVLQRTGTRVEDFLRDVGRDEVDSGIETLLAGSPLLKPDSKRVHQLRETIRREIRKYGTFLGRVESLKLERVGRYMVRCVYLYHCQDYPVAWHFTFYKPEESGEWVVISLKFNVDYEKLPATP